MTCTQSRQYSAFTHSTGCDACATCCRSGSLLYCRLSSCSIRSTISPRSLCCLLSALLCSRNTRCIYHHRLRLPLLLRLGPSLTAALPGSLLLLLLLLLLL